MDAARWSRIESLCGSALEHPAPERRAFLEKAAAGDRELCREALELVLAIEADPHFLERPLVDLPGLVAGDDAQAPLPVAIGPYRVVRSLGRGGMGEVYLAVRQAADVEQSVALKVIRRGMDTDDVLSRFRLERRILASLDHPNIARLLDAGATDDGRPYFVMEYVDGTPITDYCDARRLSIRARLELFALVCDAVQHAHQNLVVHRDLKPRNILVTDGGTPKLLDFGIGKALAPVEAFGPGVETRTHARLLTPEYAAPEQIAGGTVTTATDVYGLGVLLYELVVGRHPHVSGGESLEEIERAVLSASATRPSAAWGARETSGGRTDVTTASARRGTDPAGLRRRLAGDVDMIVLMALRKEPERRYPSAAALALDIRRHLAGRPVHARPDTLGYRAAKFARRNAAWVASATIAVLALAATTTVSVVQSRRVAREAARVAQERDKALEVRGFLLEMFGATGANAAVGDTITARGLLDLQAGRLEEAYRGRPELQADMMEVLGEGYDRLGLYRPAETLAVRALAIRQQALRSTHPDVAASLNQVGWIAHELGRPQEAESLLRRAIAIRRTGGAAQRRNLARSLNDLGVVLNARNRWHEADTVLSEALAIREAELGRTDRAVGITANNLAAAYYYLGRLADAVRVQQVAVDALRASVGEAHQRTVLALSNLAVFKHAGGDLAAAEQDYRTLIELQTRLQGADHPVTARIITHLGSLIAERALADGNQGALAQAESLYRKGTAALEARLGAGHYEVATLRERIAAIQTERGAHADAIATADRAIAVLSTRGNDADLAGALATAALAWWRLGRRDEAIALQRRAVATYTAAKATSVRARFAPATLCEYLLTTADTAAAEPVCQAALAGLEPGSARTRRTAAATRIRLARIALARGNRAPAESLVAPVRPALAELGPVVRQAFDSFEAALSRAGPRGGGGAR